MLIYSSAFNPKEAPRYDKIPAKKDRDVIKKDGKVQVLTKEQLKTGKYVPQNFSFKPLNLDNFPNAPDSNSSKRQNLFDNEFKLK